MQTSPVRVSFGGAKGDVTCHPRSPVSLSNGASRFESSPNSMATSAPRPSWRRWSAWPS